MIKGNTSITKEELFNIITEEDVYTKYIGKFIIGGRVKSPLHEDNNPSFSLFYSSGGSLLWKDFSLSKSGDCVGLVRELFYLDYIRAIERIALDFGLVRNDYNPKIYKNLLKPGRIISISSKITNINKEFNNTDLGYWSQFGISREILNLYNVKVVDRLYLDNKLFWNYSQYSPIYEYSLNNEIKCYRPLAKKEFRWLGNMKRGIMGLDQLPKDLDRLIITKAYKDIMTLRSIGLWGVCPTTEGIIINEQEIELIKSRCPNLLSIFDYDLTGVKQTNRLKRLGIPYKFMSINRSERRLDISDFYRKYGPNKTLDEINKI